MLPPRDRRLAIAALLAGIVCVGMGQTVVFSVLPPLAREMGLADIEVAAVFGLSGLFWVLLVPFWGQLSDRGGRKPFILLGLAGYAVSTALFAASIDLGLSGALGGLALYVLIVSTRSIYGLVGSATPAAAQAYIADRTPPERRTAGLSAFSAAFGVGAMLGPALGGAAAAFGPLAPLYAVAGLAAAMVATIFFLLPERSSPLPRSRRLRLRLSDRRLRAFLVFALVFGMVNAVPIQTVGFYFIDTLALSPLEAPKYVGVALTAGAMASLVAQLVFVQRFGLSPSTLLRVAPIALVLGHLVIVLSDAFAPLVLGVILSGFGAGLAVPGYSGAASLAVSSDEQGSAAGLANSASAFGFVVAPFIAYSVYGLAPEAPFLMTAVMAACLAIFAWRSTAIRSVSTLRR